MAEKNTSYDPGLFNFQSIMDDFYGFSPDKDDDEGRALKRGFQSDIIKKASDQQFAMTQAAQSQQYGMDAMQLDADLTQRNQRQLNEDAFNYGMQEMGAKYDYESRMAVDDAGRELNRMASAGDIQQNQTSLEGQENRLTLEQSAASDRAAIREKGDQDRASIVTQQTAQGDRESRGIRTQGEVDVTNIGAKGVEERAAITTQGSENRLQIDAQKEAEESLIGTRGRDERETVKAVAGEERETMGEATRQTAKDRANQRQYSRELAAR